MDVFFLKYKLQEGPRCAHRQFCSSYFKGEKVRLVFINLEVASVFICGSPDSPALCSSRAL